MFVVSVFVQSVTETIASRAASLEGLSPLHDKSRDLFLGRREGVQAYYEYVDNLGVIADTRQEAEIVLKQWRDLFTENGLTLHKSEVSQKIKSLGVELDGLSLCCRVSSKRFRTLRRALDEVLRRRKITGRALEIVIGHITFVLLGARPATWPLTSGKKLQRNLLRCEVFWFSLKVNGRKLGKRVSIPRTAASQDGEWHTLIGRRML